MKGARAALRVHLASLLALWIALAAGVPAARAQGVPNVWSIELHGGLFAPTGASGASSMVGMRYCKHFNPHVQGGMLTGLTMKSASRDGPAAGPQSGVSQVELARVEARLVPVMGFVQVNLTEKFFLVPFLGVGAGYEWLSLNASDHQAGLETSTTYGNMAWESYGGLGMRLTRHVRLNGELFYNGGSLERAVTDSSGRSWREAIVVNGVGARVGLDIIFHERD